MNKKTVAVVVPTIRPEQFAQFLEAWQPLFKKHNVCLIAVHDGDVPTLEVDGENADIDFYKKHEDVIFNYNDGCRNLGFLYIAQHLPDIEFIISFDDDVRPHGDTIQDHLFILSLDVLEVPGWVSTMMDRPPRGLPYGDRESRGVVLSHGCWFGVADYDAPTQLLQGTMPGLFGQQVVPPGLMFSLCAMNFAFRRCLLPYVYQAPMGVKLLQHGLPQLDRFADIWGGISAKVACDRENWAVVTGGAFVHHIRASNVWENLKKEAPGLPLNEIFAQEFTKPDTTNPYVLFFKSKLEQWGSLCTY